MKTESVVAALIERSGRFLIGRRTGRDELAGLWEFPGGKVEEGETPEEALQREITEELNMNSRIGECVFQTTYTYPHLRVALRFFRARLEAETPLPKVHDQLRYATPQEMKGLEFLPADLPLIKALAEGKV